MGDIDIPPPVNVQQTSSSLLTGTVSGIMGLAFQALASTRALPFWQALDNNGLWTSPEMSFWLTRFVNDPRATPEEPGGILTFGGTNSSLFTGDIQFLNMPSGASQTFWLLQMSSACYILCERGLNGYRCHSSTGISVQGQNVQIATGSAAMSAIDTGTTLIGGPSNDVKNIWAAVPGSAALGGQMAGFFSFRTSPLPI